MYKHAPDCLTDRLDMFVKSRQSHTKKVNIRCCHFQVPMSFGIVTIGPTDGMINNS